MKVENWGIDTINDWADVLFDLEITADEFKECKRLAGLSDWMVSHPVVFLNLARCKPLDAYPDVRQAYEDQANFRTDCPVAYETARRVGFSEMREQPKSKTYPLWEKHYQEVCRLHAQGAEFKKPQMLQIENKSAQSLADDEVADDFINNMRTLLAGGEK